MIVNKRGTLFTHVLMSWTSLNLDSSLGSVTTFSGSMDRLTGAYLWTLVLHPWKKKTSVVQHHWADKYSVTEAGIFGGVRRGGCYNPASPSLLPHHVVWLISLFISHTPLLLWSTLPSWRLPLHPSIHPSIPAHSAGTTTTTRSSLQDISRISFCVRRDFIQRSSADTSWRWRRCSLSCDAHLFLHLRKKKKTFPRCQSQGRSGCVETGAGITNK